MFGKKRKEKFKETLANIAAADAQRHSVIKSFKILGRCHEARADLVKERSNQGDN
jgi:cytochrome c551/c552